MTFVFNKLFLNTLKHVYTYNVKCHAMICINYKLLSIISINSCLYEQSISKFDKIYLHSQFNVSQFSHCFVFNLKSNFDKPCSTLV